ncbi:MAG: hypothetical protein UY87_C0016G0033 [Candidatus Peribacteria bacterium GW2011_GWC2_54_8]|nr:MAG: hypothetical protein UY87_C0016G0033 [Candidatus Peribacteria bacterium GW2011_GWC2_54_8]
MWLLQIPHARLCEEIRTNRNSEYGCCLEQLEQKRTFEENERECRKEEDTQRFALKEIRVGSEPVQNAPAHCKVRVDIVMEGTLQLEKEPLQNKEHPPEGSNSRNEKPRMPTERA